MTKDEAMKLALNFLEDGMPADMWGMDENGYQNAITALRQALTNDFNPDWDQTQVLTEALQMYMAEVRRLNGLLEQQMVAKMTDREAMRLALDALENHTAIKHPQQMHYRDTAIEALRQALEQPEQEPVAWLEYEDDGFLFLSGKRKDAFPVYTAPPKREWQGLTDEEIDYLEFEIGHDNFLDFARAIEQRLKEKNT